MARIKMFDPMKARGIKELDPMKERGIQSLSDLKRKRKANGRTLALDGAAWRKLRALVLAEQPLCPECKERGILEPATEVHHMDDDPTNNDRGNLVGLCKPCHTRHTLRDMGMNVSYGCDASGWPLDPAHHWNAGNHEEPNGPNRPVSR